MTAFDPFRSFRTTISRLLFTAEVSLSVLSFISTKSTAACMAPSLVPLLARLSAVTPGLYASSRRAIEREGGMQQHTNVDWPVKSREIHTVLLDSRIWNDFEFRDDDIIVGTYAKSGTTWVQQILGQLIFEGKEGLPLAHMSPWLDFTLPSAEVKLNLLRAQTHRRFIKTHLPVDALVFSPRAKYIYVG